MNDTLVSVVIVNWNHGRFLGSCLDALHAQEFPSSLPRVGEDGSSGAPPAIEKVDIVVVDNGSSDGSPEWVRRSYPDVRLLAFPDNRGFSSAFNAGARSTDSPFVLSLNPDVTVRPDFIYEMVCTCCQDERVGIVAPKLLQAGDPRILDSTGLFIDLRRRPYDRGQGSVDQGQYDGQPYVFGACGAAALYRRTMLDDLSLGGEYFDERFFAYYEDADLAWRAQLRGWRSAYAPCAVAIHARGWGDTLIKKGRIVKTPQGPRLALRNRYLMTIKNDALAGFLVDLPRIVTAELPRLTYTALVAPDALLGIVDLVRACPSTLRKRRQIRSRRTVDEKAVRQWFVAPEDASVGNVG